MAVLQGTYLELSRSLADYLRNPNGAGAAGSFSATIDWGDGASATPGTISGPDAGGEFTLSGSHTYTDQNASPLTVAVVLHRANAGDVTVSDTVDIAPNITSTSSSIRPIRHCCAARPTRRALNSG